MKKNWLLYLVLFFLALNLGTIITFAYLRFQEQQIAAAPGSQPPVPMRKLWRELNLDATQRQTLHTLLPEHRQRVQEARQRLAQKRQELFDLIKGENPDWQAIQAKVREISVLQSGLEEEIARFMLEFKKHLRPEQQTVFVNLVQARLAMGRMGCGPGSRWGRGRGFGLGRGAGQGSGPAGPDCPPPSK